MAVVVTGATGMLGSRIVLQLARSDAVSVVCCPVRRGASNPSASLASRLADIVATWPVADATDAIRAKLRVAHIDFASEDDALVDRDAQQVVDDVARRRCIGIVHCAALDGYLHPPALLDRVNVGGTRAAASIARRLDAPLVHISSCAVRLWDDCADDGVAHSSTGFRTAYAASKTAAERFVISAIQTGETLHRSSRAVDVGYLYDSQSANAWCEDAHVVECIWRLCERLGAAPRFNSDDVCVDHTHVDDAAAAIADLLLVDRSDSAQSSSSNSTPLLHLRSAATAVSWNREMLPFIVKHSKTPIAEVPYDEWRAKVDTYCRLRGARLRWLRDLMSPDLEAQLRVMFGSGLQRHFRAAHFRTPDVASRIQAVLARRASGNSP